MTTIQDELSFWKAVAEKRRQELDDMKMVLDDTARDRDAAEAQLADKERLREALERLVNAPARGGEHTHAANIARAVLGDPRIGIGPDGPTTASNEDGNIHRYQHIAAAIRALKDKEEE